MRDKRRNFALLTLTILGSSALLAAAGCGGSSGGDSSTTTLPAPALVEAVPGDGTATVKWSPVEGATGFLVYWCAGTDLVDPSCSVEQFAVQYVVTGLTPAATYAIAVATVRDGVPGSPSPDVLVTLPPAVPSVVSALATAASILVDWTPVDGATSYEVYRSTSPDLTPETGELVHTNGPPFTDSGVESGRMYYYVVVAVGTGGKGQPSSIVAAVVEVVVGAPTSVTVTIPEEAPNTILVTWSPPVGEVPDSYNLYWDTAPGVDLTSNKIEGAVSPYMHTGLEGRTAYYYAVTAVLGGVEGAFSSEVSGTPRGSPGGGGGGGGGGHEEGYGNNLSLPMIFADGYGILGARLQGTSSPWLDVATGLRPSASDVIDPFPYFDAVTATTLNGVTLYPQKTPSTWQAEWRDGSIPPEPGGDTSQNVVVDWGDNLRSSSITTRSVVRVETILYQDVVDDPMGALGMTLIGGSGQTESWGTDAVATTSTRRHVFAVNARLRIEKLLAQGGDPDPDVPAIDLSVVDGFESDEGHVTSLAGPGGGGGGGGGGAMPLKYGAEINVSGKCVYGFVWALRTSEIPEPDRAGWWRATFVLDPEVTIGTQTVQNNTFLVAVDPLDTGATVDVLTNTSSIEFEVR